ncbi:class I SAM-dependent methyltransferase [Aureimonas fodinaquatilis]|uniref:Class I SAM-dependent methyltransferase n=1 Tax=Aureimonas fodinaquatilis TaxID=2565783 RepID=A0A5B0DX93_9HYPH|nr:class I SAM-dependent methyltransferase [Aureimonas fodinaquatilis]KAA0970381.1 class I SAM-dependent methyltransferase [Aureimonas fodinaquatilis]
MSNNPGSPKNWFESGGKDYARFRPDYPAQLAEFLADTAPSRSCAVDVGCGSGQLTTLLAQHFDRVIGCDPSADQLDSAPSHPNVEYVCASAENLPLKDRSVSLIVAAQAAHWFNLPHFYKEVSRIGVKDAALALVSYGVLQPGEELQDRFRRFYHDEAGPYWSPERSLVDSGYRDMQFPFKETQPPRMDIRLAWNLNDFLGYISTWSAVRNARNAGREDIVLAFGKDVASLWGDPATTRSMFWPINMRVGTLGA